ncbi:hypothetical protein ACOSP7_012608 [Xanthoceras sorbifolium]
MEDSPAAGIDLVTDFPVIDPKIAVSGLLKGAVGCSTVIASNVVGSSVSEGFSSTQPDQGAEGSVVVSSPSLKRWKRRARMRFQERSDDSVSDCGGKRGLVFEEDKFQGRKKVRCEFLGSDIAANSIDVIVRSFNCGHIDCVVRDQDGLQWRFTGFYGDPKQASPEQSLLLLRRLAGMDNLPWIIGGDFNEIMWGDEKMGGLARCGAAMDNFREAIDCSGLMDLSFMGNKFTWCNRQFGGDVIWERLDRCFYNLG